MRDTSMGSLSHPNWGPGPQPRAGVHGGWESNRQPFHSQANAQSTEPHQPWLKLTIFTFVIKYLVKNDSDSVKILSFLFSQNFSLWF